MTVATTERLVAFVVDTPGAAIGAIERDWARRLVLDTLGVALAAAPRAIGKTISGYVGAAGGRTGPASVIGAGFSCAPELAALANGTLANALDFDEGSHLSTHILPAALAVAESRGLSGRAVLEAYILAFEAAARLTQAIDVGRRQGKGPTHRGWWHVGLIGPMAAALASARLLKLDKKHTAMALGIATCSGGGFRRNMGTMAKALHSGNAARGGVQAATLAAAGFTADPAIVEQPLGFLAAVCPPEERDEAAVALRLGNPFVLAGQQRLKFYPAVNPGHPLIDAALRLAAEGGFAAGDIEAIEADLHPFSLLRPRPWDEESAGFSSAFLLASALLHGKFGLDQVSDEAVHDPRIVALMDRVKEVKAGEPETVVLRLKGGATRQAEVHPVKRLTTWEQVQAKFRDCAGRALPPAAVAALEAQVMGIEGLASVAEMMRLARG